MVSTLNGREVLRFRKHSQGTLRNHRRWSKMGCCRIFVGARAMDDAIGAQVGQPRSGKREYQYLHFKLLPGDEELLNLLSEDHRALLTADGSYEELAIQFGIPTGTVRSRLHRARAMMVQLRAEVQQNDPRERDARVH
jgi:Sigma-70, region 4